MAPKCVSRSVDWLTYLYVRYARSYSRKATFLHPFCLGLARFTNLLRNIKSFRIFSIPVHIGFKGAFLWDTDIGGLFRG